MATHTVASPLQGYTGTKEVGGDGPIYTVKHVTEHILICTAGVIVQKRHLFQIILYVTMLQARGKLHQ